MATSKKLTVKQKIFVQEFLVDMNATQAAIRAGYSERTAYSQGQRMLKNVEIKSVIDAAMAERSERTGITQDRVLEELAHIGFLNIQDAFDEAGTLKPIVGLPEDVARAIGGMELTETDGGNTKTIKIKIIDKTKALEMLGRHLKMFTDKHEVAGPGGIPIGKTITLDMSPEEALRLYQSKLRNGASQGGRKGRR